MEVKHQQGGAKGRFYIEVEGQEMAKMIYSFAGDTKFIIEHTEVDPSQGGKGLGRLLLDAAVDFARRNNYKIVPLCPYAKAVFAKTPELGDVLA